jgi:ribosomal protein S27AE
MKSVKPERLNHSHACPRCGGFLAVFGPAKDDMWQCTKGG